MPAESKGVVGIGEELGGEVGGEGGGTDGVWDVGRHVAEFFIAADVEHEPGFAGGPFGLGGGGVVVADYGTDFGGGEVEGEAG